jgi:uncharacterized linocin/CFP29 family protein
MFKREIAPVTDAAWKEIDERAKEVLKNYLSARRVLHVNGPKGIDYTSVNEGRLGTINEQEGINYGFYQVKPLLEARVEFELERWELDNTVRGAKDINLEALEKAVRDLALFEEKVLYYGLENGSIHGLLNDVSQDTISFGDDTESIMQAISQGMIRLKEHFVDKPYSLIVGEKGWSLLNKEMNGYPLLKRVEDVLGTEVIYSHVLKEALLIPSDHQDLEMTIGQDYTIGYQSSDNKTVRFYITESFTYRTLDSNIIIQFQL